MTAFEIWRKSYFHPRQEMDPWQSIKLCKLARCMS